MGGSCASHAGSLPTGQDDTIAVYEPAVPNSGLQQGTLLARQKVPKAHRPGQFFSWKDFNVAQDMVFFGRTFHLADCNASTEAFLYKNGIDLNPREEAPADPYTMARFAAENAAPEPADGGIDKYQQVRPRPLVVRERGWL